MNTKLQRIIALIICLCVCFSLAACSSRDSNKKQPSKVTYNFSNLVSEDSQKTVDSIMGDAGITADRRKVFFNHVKQFNGAVDAKLLNSDFAEGDPFTPKYDAYDYQDQWLRKYPDFNGYNCRITAFGLFGDFVSVNKDAEIRDSDLFMDTESLDADTAVLSNSSDRNKFLQLFSVVPTTDTTDTSVHAKAVKEDWKKRGITFETNDKISLITVWLHNKWSEDENELSIGHTGVLIKTGDKYLFIEKLAFQEPYQATYFSTKDDLADYLMKKYDVEWGQDTAKPFIMENDSVIC